MQMWRNNTITSKLRQTVVFRATLAKEWICRRENKPGGKAKRDIHLHTRKEHVVSPSVQFMYTRGRKCEIKGTNKATHSEAGAAVTSYSEEKRSARSRHDWPSEKKMRRYTQRVAKSALQAQHQQNGTLVRFLKRMVVIQTTTARAISTSASLQLSHQYRAKSRV